MKMRPPKIVLGNYILTQTELEEIKKTEYEKGYAEAKKAFAETNVTPKTKKAKKAVFEGDNGAAEYRSNVVAEENADTEKQT